MGTDTGGKSAGRSAGKRNTDRRKKWDQNDGCTCIGLAGRRGDFSAADGSFYPAAEKPAAALGKISLRKNTGIL